MAINTTGYYTPPLYGGYQPSAYRPWDQPARPAGPVDAMSGNHFAELAEQMRQQAELLRWQRDIPTAQQARERSAKECQEKPIVYVGGKNPNAVVAVIDTFSSAESGKVNHGEAVTETLKRSGGFRDEEIQRIDDGIMVSKGSVELRFAGLDSPTERLEAGIELQAVETMRRTSRVLEEIEGDPNSKIHTINISLGTSRLTVLNSFLRSSLEFKDDKPGLTEAGRQLFETVGLPAGTDKDSLRSLARAVGEKVDQVFDSNPTVLAERERHAAVTKRLADKGVACVLAAGNDRRDLEEFLEIGMLDETFDDSVMSNPYNVVVGAIDDNGSPRPADHTLACFSSDDPEVDFLAIGVDIPISQPGASETVSGTSFSAPYVAGKLARIREEHPSYSTAQLTDHLLFSGASIASSPLAVIY